MPRLYESRKRILVTGGAGFLGSHVSDAFIARGDEVFVLDTGAIGKVRHLLNNPRFHYIHDSIFNLELIDSLVAKVDLVYHLAAVVGGLGANREHPGRFFHDNAIMGIHAIEQARRSGIEKFVCVGTVCSYPKFTHVPFREDALWDGYPEETNAPYGLAPFGYVPTLTVSWLSILKFARSGRINRILRLPSEGFQSVPGLFCDGT